MPAAVRFADDTKAAPSGDSLFVVRNMYAFPCRNRLMYLRTCTLSDWMKFATVSSFCLLCSGNASKLLSLRRLFMD